MRRFLNMIFAAMGLVLATPILIVAMLMIWLQDFHSPLYVASRVGQFGKVFSMFKLRSMVIYADRTGVDSTAADDRRITPIGRFVRAFKLDELPQLWNVLIGDMNLVGPRPNVPRETALYTEEEQKLLTVPPGITDLASIVFSDEAQILKDKPDPDLTYHQCIRPWKNRLGLLYVRTRSISLDFQIILLTCMSFISKENVLMVIQDVVRKLSGDELLVRMVLRKEPLLAYPPPGANKIVQSRDHATNY